MNESLGQLLIQFNKILIDSKVFYLIQNKKLYIIYKNYINIGILNDGIFKPEIVVYNNFKETIEQIIKKIQINKYDMKKEINTKIAQFKDTKEYILFLNNDINYISKIDIYQKKTIECSPNNFQAINKNQTNNSNMHLKNENSFENNGTNNKSNYQKSIEIYKSLKIINSEQNKELKNIISVLIDMEKINNKMSIPLNHKNNLYDYYYIINYEWFKKYIQLNNLIEIFN